MEVLVCLLSWVLTCDGAGKASRSLWTTSAHTHLQAHEDSEKLREIVLPMEQEIAELKAKLLRAEELILEIQVKGQPGNEERERALPDPGPPASSLLPFP